jgi:uncharacterized protein (DUF4415 family)
MLRRVEQLTPPSTIKLPRGIPRMSKPTRRPTNPIAAAEALFQPRKKMSEAPALDRPVVPHARELVSMKFDSDVLAYFQEDGAGWQDRINNTLRAAMDRGE